MATTKSDKPTPPGKPSYICLIRLPFPRGDFVDPDPVEWDSAKDAALWKIISKKPNSKDVNFPELAARFQVSLPFLLQQASWLYERHFAQMRAQMRKVGAPSTSSPGPQDGVVGNAAGSGHQQRPASRGSRAPSALSVRSKDSPQFPSSSVVSPIRANAPTISRTPSTRTVTQSRFTQPPSPKESAPARAFRSSFGSHRKQPTLEDINAEDSSSPPVALSSSTISSSSSDAPVHPSIAKSQMVRRPADLRTISSDGDAEDDEEDDESSGGFLPFASRAEQAPTNAEDGSSELAPDHQDPSATLRTASSSMPSSERTPLLKQDVFSSTSSSADSGPETRRRPLPHAQTMSTATAQSSHRPLAANMARTNSVPGQVPGRRQANQGSAGDRRAAGLSGKTPGALSPRHRAELGRMSGRTSKDGSEGTPSMGSSFSDLDDASVTQSALEDALLSNMQHGGMASRMSTFSQALRSKYLPQKDPQR